MYVTGNTIIRFATVLGALELQLGPALPQFSLDGAAEGAAGGNREHQKGAVRYMLRAFGNTGRAQAAWRKRQCQ